jgi:hypothetical protein
VGSRGPLPGAQRSPAAYDAILTVRVAQSVVERVDTLRGDTPRSAWLRQQIEESVLAAEELGALE